MNSICSTAQRAFVKGRQIFDAVLIANEVVEEVRKKKVEGLVFKIDFEKAYDHVEWAFLDDILGKKGFGNLAYVGGAGLWDVCRLQIFLS